MVQIRKAPQDLDYLSDHYKAECRNQIPWFALPSCGKLILSENTSMQKDFYVHRIRILPKMRDQLPPDLFSELFQRKTRLYIPILNDKHASNSMGSMSKAMTSHAAGSNTGF